MVSMKDIAERCGVSIASVSKALNNHSDISKETRKRILLVSKEMGYFPNAAARTLKTNKTYNIGVLFIDNARSGLTHDYFSSVLENFKVQAESQGYDITFISNKGIGDRTMSWYEHCKYRNMDGVVIACVDFHDPEVVELVNSEIPVVTIDHIFNNSTAIISDNVKGIRDLVTYIYSMGHRKIAYIHGDDTSVTRDRLASFYMTLDELRVKIPENYVKSGLYHETQKTAEYTRELLMLKDRPTCIIYPDDYASIGGINVIREMGLRIPEDISIAGYDGLHLSQILNPKLTTVCQDIEAIGKKAAEKLIDLIERPKSTLVERIVIEGKVINGESVEKLPH